MLTLELKLTFPKGKRLIRASLEVIEGIFGEEFLVVLCTTRKPSQTWWKFEILSSNIGDNKEIYLPLFIGRGILFHLQTCESKLEKMTKGCSQCGRVFDVKVLTESAYEGYKIHINKCGQLILCEICGESFKGKVSRLFLLVWF